MMFGGAKLICSPDRTHPGFCRRLEMMRLPVRKVTTNIGQAERQLGYSQQWHIFGLSNFTLHIHREILIIVHTRGLGDTGLRRGDGSVGRSRATSGYHLVDEDGSTFMASLP